MHILRVLKHTHLVLLWISQVLSAMGDYFYEIAVMWIAIKLAGSSAGMVGAAQAGSALFFGLLGGVYADRWNRRTTMIVVDILRALAVITLPVLALTGSVQFWYLIVVATIVGGLGSLFNPALQASLPVLVSETKTLQATNALMDVTRRLARALGPSLAGVLVAFMPLTQFFTLDAVSFGISAVTVFLLGTRYAWQPAKATHSQQGIKGIWLDIAEGFKITYSHKVLFWFIATDSILAGAWFAAFTVGIPLLASQVLKGNVGVYGLILGAYGVGNVLSNLVIGSLSIRRPVATMTMGRIIVGAGFLLMVSVPIFYVALLGSAIAAIGGPMGDIPITMMIQTELPSQHIGKVYSLLFTLMNLGSALGLLLAAPLFQFSGVQVGIAICSLIMVLSSATGLMRFGFK
ncbi:MFS transporter [Ktedonosporobacter rubrisoli]|uniref:MFS transporter n=1 Tax=Ktedonosporobacter rubrisoli TaxID=2509675 RepID=A0A4V0Z060_KTERU|nr:MFS transporter [Ktedonosporobacter rubrisoli]QBD82091.1 MFS transporter [Ktedonosporobacter rubrisoli]